MEQNLICKILHLHIHMCMCYKTLIQFLQDNKVRVSLSKNCSQLNFLLLRKNLQNSILIHCIVFEEKTLYEACSVGKYPCTSKRKPWHFTHFSTLPSEDMSDSLGFVKGHEQNKEHSWVYSYSYLKTRCSLQYQCCLCLERTSTCENLLVKRIWFSKNKEMAADKSLLGFKFTVQ